MKPVNQLLQQWLQMLQHRDRMRRALNGQRGTFHMHKGKGWRAKCSARAICVDLDLQRRSLTSALSHGGQRLRAARRRSFLRSLAVRHRAGAQRQPPNTAVNLAKTCAINTYATVNTSLIPGSLALTYSAQWIAPRSLSKRWPAPPMLTTFSTLLPSTAWCACIRRGWARIAGYGMLVFPRPFTASARWYCPNWQRRQKSYAVASESVAFNALTMIWPRSGRAKCICLPTAQWLPANERPCQTQPPAFLYHVYWALRSPGLTAYLFINRAWYGRAAGGKSNARLPVDHRRCDAHPWHQPLQRDGAAVSSRQTLPRGFD